MRRKPYKAHVYAELKERILSGKLTAGTPLNELELSKELGVSRTPIRQAIQQLDHESLVEIMPGRGAFVTFISLQDLKDTIQLLQILEGAAARMAAVRINLSKLKKFEEGFTTLQQKEPHVTYEEEQTLGSKLHEFILKEAGNAKIISISRSTREKIQALCIASIKSPGRVPEAITEHLKIITALKRRDALTAEGAMVTHLESVYKTLVGLIT